MDLQGTQLLGSGTSRAGTDTFTAIDPREAAPLEGSFHEAIPAEVDRAFALAAAAHPAFELAGREARARFLETIAERIEALGDGLLQRASAETGLPLPRLTGERGRTCGQLRMFAKVVREGAYLDVRIERADPDRQPLPKPDVRSMRHALGPVAVFGASNFPLAFSVAGGDTASALAAGCPVVVKAHPNHPGTSELVGRAIVAAVRDCGLPEGVFSLLQGRGHEVGLEMVRHPLCRAVGFTGSLAGGRALFDAAAARPVPIPVFAEMGSTNPMFLLPQKLAAEGAALAEGLAGSVTLGVGQFCTNPGLVFAVRDAGAETFVTKLAEHLGGAAEAPMLHAGIRSAYERRLDELAAVPGVEVRVRDGAVGPCGAKAALLVTDARNWTGQETLREEVFGPATVVVLCDDLAELAVVAGALPGQLTATVTGTEAEVAQVPGLLATLADRAGRVLFGGFPTGVDVSSAMVHGGPYPATTDSRSTSVGTAAIERFTRPVAWQSFPQALLPEDLRDAGPAGLWRRVDGEFGQA